MNIVEPKQHVARIVEELKQEAARRHHRLAAMTSPEQEEDGFSDNSLTHELDRRLPPFSFEYLPVDRNKARYTLTELVRFEDSEFVQNAYRAILKRPPDPDGMAHAIGELRSGRVDKIDVLAQLSLSPEGQVKGVHVQGLGWRAGLRRICRLPLFRRIAIPIWQFLRLPISIRDQQRAWGVIFSRQESLANYLRDDVAMRLQSLAELNENSWRLLEDRKKTSDGLIEQLGESCRALEERINAQEGQRKQDTINRTAEIEDLRRVYNKYRTQVELTEKHLRRELENVFLKHQEVKTELVHQSQLLQSFLQSPSHLPSAKPKAPQDVRPAAARDAALDAFFASFDEQFRGNREDVKQRLRVYLLVLQENKIGGDEDRILDVACGRGEWLELLKEGKINATGIDVNSVLVEQCRDRGLEVQQAEVIEYLITLADGSLAAVSAFHILEHLQLERVISFLNQALRVLRPGGLLLIETPNPENVLVGSCNFYNDPTHRNPLPKPVLRFIIESRGFVVLDTLDLNPSDEKPLPGDSETVQRLNRYFYGPMDYAIIARKV